MSSNAQLPDGLPMCAASAFRDKSNPKINKFNSEINIIDFNITIFNFYIDKIKVSLYNMKQERTKHRKKLRRFINR